MSYGKTFTNKIHFFKDKDFVFHLDDDLIELSFFKGSFIKQFDNFKTKGISIFGNKNWKEDCKKAIESYDNR